PKLVILSSTGQNSTTQAANQEPAALTRALLEHGLAVLAVNHFSSPEPSNQITNFYTTYNRTLLQERVRDLLTLCAAAGSVDPRKPLPFHVILAGSGPAGLWSLLAAPAAAAVIADCAELDSGSESALLAPNLFCPGLLNIGGFEGAALLAAPHPLLLHNIGSRFSTQAVDSTYAAIDARNQLRLSPRPLSDKDLVKWASQLRL
ncbi:MAG TPA: hypothetical protein VNT26_16320, partial [Candidatus Sulfotelmatobacter sp.]|nr:hypothetical protein [Candidatus Sulfotelmatobacter sp.]